jgi:hypothetical protein
VTHFWSAGQPIIVETRTNSGSGQIPRQFTWQGRSHSVTETTKIWRVDIDWWRDSVTEITKIWRVDIDWWRVRIWRAYFKISTDTGLLVVLYQDLMSEDWFLQRLYD